LAHRRATTLAFGRRVTMSASLRSTARAACRHRRLTTHSSGRATRAAKFRR
jgi:hypothetical protein